MHSKIITTNNHSNTAIYSNNGSSVRAVNYLGKEEKGGEKQFFSEDKEHSFDKKTVTTLIDNNVKGLKATDDKFESLIIAPSQSELAHIGEDPEKLKDYIRQVMKNYEDNFELSPKAKSIGKPVEFLSAGEAPYLNQPGNKGSYFVTFKIANGNEKTLWGVDLKKAVEESLVKPGDQVFIENTGKVKVAVGIDKVVNGEKITDFKEIERNNWQIVTPEFKAAQEAAKPPQPKVTAAPLWFATIHHNREFNHTDEKISRRVVDLKGQGMTLKEIIDNKPNDMFLKTYNATNTDIEQYYKTGGVKSGDIKPGDQRHIHVIVSRRDKTMQHTLNPNTFSRFNKNAFFEKNAKSFNTLFNYNGKTSTLAEHKGRYLSRKIEYLNKKYNLPLGYLDEKKIMQAFKESKDISIFTKRFNKLEYKIRKGEYVKDTLEFLTDPEQSKGKKFEPKSYAAEAVISSLKGLADKFEGNGEFMLPLSQRRKIARKVKNTRDAEREQSR